MHGIQLHIHSLCFKDQKAQKISYRASLEGRRKEKDIVGRTKKQQESEGERTGAESCLVVSDVLSLPGFRTKFTSFHDIAKVQLLV